MSKPKTLPASPPNVTLTGNNTHYGTVGAYILSYAGYSGPQTIYAAVFGPAPTNFTVTNTGKIESDGTSALNFGIVLGAAGTIINNGAITGGGGLAIFGASGASSLANNGAINATLGDGAYLQNPTQFTNAGAITAAQTAIALAAGGTVTNSGGITGANGIRLQNTLAAANQAYIYNQGSIHAYSTIDTTYGFGAGFISYGVGLYANQPATLINAGILYGNHAGVVFNAIPTQTAQGPLFNAAGDVSNFGTIASPGAAVALYGGGRVTNSALIQAGQEGIDLANPTTAPAYALNTGLIEATSTPFSFYGGFFTYIATGILLSGLGTVENLAQGTILAGYGEGINLSAEYFNTTEGKLLPAPAAIINNGLIQADYGALFYGIGGIANTGTILAQYTGVSLQGPVISLGNAGLIAVSNGAGAVLRGPGSVTNTGTIAAPNGDAIVLQNGGAVTNTGYLLGGQYAVLANTAPATITNAGLIHGLNTGIALAAGGTIRDTGTIIGGGYAVSFASSFANRLIVNAASDIVGAVNGGGGILELAADGKHIGAVSAAQQAQFANFGTVEIDKNATWDFTGPFTFASPNPLLNDGEIKETAHDTLTIDAAITGAGEIQLGKDRLVLNNSLVSTQKIKFTGTHDTLALGDPAAFRAKLEKFSPADTIDLTTIPLADITATQFVKGVLTLDATTGTLHLTFTSPSNFGTETFAFTALGPGTAITLSPAAAVPHPILASPTSLTPLVTFQL